MVKEFIEFGDTGVAQERNIGTKRLLKQHEITVTGVKQCKPETKLIKPVIKINKADEKVKQIEIDCKCGEKFVLDIVYE